MGCGAGQGASAAHACQQEESAHACQREEPDCLRTSAPSSSTAGDSQQATVAPTATEEPIDDRPPETAIAEPCGDRVDGVERCKAYFDGITGELECTWSAAKTTDDGTALCCAEAFDQVFSQFAARPVLGWRPGGGPFEWISFQSFYQRSQALAASLTDRLPPGARVGICASNCLDWFVADFGCLWAGLPVFAISEAWDQPILQGVLQHVRVEAVFCDLDTAPRVLRLDGVPSLKLVVVANNGRQPTDMYRSVTPQSHVELCDFGALCTDAPTDKVCVKRDPESLHTIIFTSGTTGLPKGVIYSDRLWLHNMISYPAPLQVGFSYMPLAFITDRHTVWTSIWNGGRVGISRHYGDTDCIFKDLTEVRPTTLKGVPKFYEGVLQAARLVGDSKLQLLGGRASTLICGAGHLAPDAADFFRGCTATKLERGEGGRFADVEVPVKMFVGYGSTETGNLAQNGRLSAAVDYRLRPVEGCDMETDCKHGVGQLAVKTGAMMFSGYIDNDEAYKNAFDEDGYYLMGDVVQVTRQEDGSDYVVVLGRAKSSVKLSNGKWVFLESLEDFYRQCPGEPQIKYVMIYGDARHADLVAVVDLESLPTSPSPEFVASLLERLRAYGRQANKPNHELAAQVIVAHEHFSRNASPQTLNGTGKLHRRNLQKLYQEEIDEAFARLASEGSMGLGSLDQDKSFTSQGGTSIQAVRIAAMYSKLGVPVSRVVGMLLNGEQPVQQIQRTLTTMSQAQQIADEMEDSVLPEDIQPAPPRGLACAGKALVTGGTGFIGPFVVSELLSAGWNVVCLVREVNEARAWNKLQHALANAHRWDPDASSRLSVVCGELEPQFGLEIEAYESLATPVDLVMHLAAKVNLHQSYSKHRHANVEGTLAVLRFAARNGARLIYASTTDAFRVPDGQHCPVDVGLDADPCDLEEIKKGYASSKWVCDRLVSAAHARGLQASIARLGMVVGDSDSGVCNAKDAYCRHLIGFAQTKSFPETPPGARMIRALPADVAARALVALASDKAVGRSVQIASVAEPMSLVDLREMLLRFGPPFGELPIVPFKLWMERCELDAGLSAWPVLAGCKDAEEFPAYDRRGVQAGDSDALAGVLGTTVASELALGTTERCVHAMLRYLYFGCGETETKVP